MKKEILTRKNNYSIPYLSNVSGSEKQIVIISHGFGSSKESPTAQALSAALPDYGFGTISYDFPAHGESPVDGEYLTIDNCLDDLSAIEEYIHSIAPKAEISYFSSSFGAYINLIYLASRNHRGTKSLLRCAAIDMPGMFYKESTPEEKALMDSQGYIMLDRGFERPLKITRKFYEDLSFDKHNIFKLYEKHRQSSFSAQIALVHGTEDEVASIDLARQFSSLFGAILTEVEGADHAFTNPGGIDRVIASAIDFFK